MFASKINGLLLELICVDVSSSARYLILNEIGSIRDLRRRRHAELRLSLHLDSTCGDCERDSRNIELLHGFKMIIISKI
jgi:hypothetical protein